MTKTAVYFPLEGTLRDDIRVLLALSDGQGRPVHGSRQEWLVAVAKVIVGLRSSLRDDGDMQLAEALTRAGEA